LRIGGLLQGRVDALLTHKLLSVLVSGAAYSAGEPPATWRSVLCISSFIWGYDSR
jgi:hypothetical protein